jgi:hypothetical protein
VLSSQNFTLIVEFSAGAYQNLASSDEILGLDDKLAQVQALIYKLNAEIKFLPPITPEDKDKVLTANEDGTAGWKKPTGGSGGASVQSDYLQNDSSEPDYIKNRPFYEEHGTKKGRITWDGTLAGKPYEVFGNVVLVQVSTKTDANIKQYSCTLQTTDGISIDFTEQDAVTLNEDCEAFLVDGVPMVLCARKPTKVLYLEETRTIPSAGIYFMTKGTAYVKQLYYTITDYHYVKKINAHKFLDFGMELLLDAIATLKTSTSGPAFCTVEQALSLEVGETYTVEFDGAPYVCVAKDPGGGAVPYIGNLYVLDESKPNTGEPFYISDVTPQTLVCSAEPGDHTVTVYKTKYAQIPSECLVLTSPNGTKYRLAVSDDGTLSAVIAE